MKYNFNAVTEKIEIESTSCNESQLGLLEELIDIGRAEEKSGNISVDINTLYNYSANDTTDQYASSINADWETCFSILNFPPVFTETLEFNYLGGVGQTQFTIETFYNKRRVNNKGPLLFREKDQLLLGSIGPELYNFYKLVNNQFSDQRKRLNFHRMLLACAQELERKNIFSIAGSTKMRAFYEVKEPIRLKIIPDEDLKTVHITPELTNNLIPPHIQQKWEKIYPYKNEADEVVNLDRKSVETDGEYIYFTEAQNRQINIIQKIVRQGKEDQESIKEFLKYPEQFVDPEIIDIDSLSERAAEIGFFTPIHIPGFENIELDWWGNATIIPIGSQESFVVNEKNIEALTELLDKAKSSSEDHITYNGKTVDIDSLERLISIFNLISSEMKHSGLATKQVLETQLLDKKVLLAKLNIEKLEYTEREPPLCQPPFESLKCPPHFTLKSHQITGVQWLQNLYSSNKKGGLLADDMGLGKTLQILYFLEWAQEKRQMTGKPPIAILLVLPLSLIQNWKKEYDFFFPQGKLSFSESEDLKDIRNIIGRQYDRGTIHCITYQTLQRRQLDYARIKWDLIIADEVQYAKNPGSRITNALKTMQCNFRLAVTGTPVENSYIELWNIIDWISPGMLGSLSEFNKEYKVRSGTNIQEINEIARKIRERIDQIFLRRTKENVLSNELPKKFIHETNISFAPDVKLLVPMETFQLKQYDAIRKDAQKSNLKNTALSYINKMKQVSEHPRLLDKDFQFTTEYWNDDTIHESCKMIAVEQIIDIVKAREEKVLIFCILRATQHILSGWLSRKYGIRVPILNGLSPVKNKAATQYTLNNEIETENLSRVQMVTNFNQKTGFGIMILSPIAAGVGLTITGANHVIHFSRHWNPAKEDQATDRVYRIGQKKEVHIYYPKAITAKFATFDVNIDRIIKKKRALSREVLFPTNYSEAAESIISEFLA